MSIEHAWIIDDLSGCRQWLERALQLAFPGIRTDMAGSVAEGRRLLADAPLPPLALIDLGLGDGSGLELIEALSGRSTDTLIVVSTVFDDDAHLFPALRAGAQGYVLKDQAPDVLADMLKGIAAGQPPLSPSIARRLLRHFRPETAVPAQPNPLSPRETEVLGLIAKGFTVQQVADALSLTRNTTAGYLKEIYRKLSVSSRAEATLEATRLGLVRPSGA